MALLSEIITKLESFFQHGNPMVMIDGVEAEVESIAHDAETGVVNIVTKKEEKPADPPKAA